MGKKELLQKEDPEPVPLVTGDPAPMPLALGYLEPMLLALGVPTPMSVYQETLHPFP